MRNSKFSARCGVARVSHGKEGPIGNQHCQPKIDYTGLGGEKDGVVAGWGLWEVE